ncbi:MAG: DUF3524 domain-containing protein [Pseudomonadales bacterium]|nr:DUF3524 domain-containing protein [Pseudomonadales bacterium]
MRILLLSPYDALSHQYWHAALKDLLPEHIFTIISLPARYFSWRFRGNSLTLSQDARLLDEYDLLVATSMTDLAALKGMCQAIASLPSILYFHENQFAYPDAGDARHLIERQITSLYSAMAADRLVFNSSFNRTSFLQGVEHLLAKMPDGVPVGINDLLVARSEVISVPLRERTVLDEADHAVGLVGKSSSCLNIVWNHRWEYDKGVEQLGELVSILLANPLDFRMHIIGQSFRKVPASMVKLCDQLRAGDKLGHCGFIESRHEYLALLDRCDVVLSTAIHEFQGLAVLEAVQAGCLPVVPDGLAYVEFIADVYRYANPTQAINLLHEFAQQKLSRQTAQQNTPAAMHDAKLEKLVAAELTATALPAQVRWRLVQSQWRTTLARLTELP